MASGPPPLDPPRRLLMGSGPSTPEGRVLRAMAAPLPADEPVTRSAVALEMRRLLRRIVRSDTADGLVVTGASRAGIEAVLDGLVAPGECVLVGVFGHFGELLCTLATRHGAHVERVEAEWGACVDQDALVAAIYRLRPRVVALVHADTSTGVLQPMDAVGQACRQVDSLLVLDAVLSLGGCAVEFDAWGVDAAIGGLQKCLGGPPGQAVVALSPRAIARLRTRESAPRSAYLNLRRLLDDDTWAAPTPLLFGLLEALRMIDAEGLDVRWARHAQASRALRAGLQAMGLTIFGAGEHAVPMITLVEVPPGVSEPGVREALLTRHGVEIMAAFGPLRGRVWRIGTMGVNASAAAVFQLLSALETVLSAAGVSVPRGAASDAAADVLAAALSPG